ncbi:conserved hypothetical protein [Agrobacterium fabrum str. J-07]|nr:conserved hypothetical protein [Agrobacterium fabrum str. J-07]
MFHAARRSEKILFSVRFSKSALIGALENAENLASKDCYRALSPENALKRACTGIR